MLSTLAVKVAEDPFVKIKGMIQDMIEKLLEEEADEANHKGYCDEEISKTVKDRDYRLEEIEALHASLVSVILTERLDCLLQLRLCQGQLLLTCVQLLKTGMKCLDLLQTVVAILHRLRNLFVTIALVIRLVSLLLKQLLDHILDHPLDLHERILRHLDRERREHRALVLLGHIAENRLKLRADHILAGVRGVERFLHQAKRSL